MVIVIVSKQHYYWIVSREAAYDFKSAGIYLEPICEADFDPIPSEGDNSNYGLRVLGTSDRPDRTARR